MKNDLKTFQKLVTFSPILYKIGEQKASSLGISFAEYLRYLVITDNNETEGRLKIASKILRQTQENTKDTTKNLTESDLDTIIAKEVDEVRREEQ